MLTKGAIGNLINRYRAVLRKCNLMNVFGSLAVAGMLVMVGPGTASATEYTTQITGTESGYDGIKSTDSSGTIYTFAEGDRLVLIAQDGIVVTSPNITIKNNLDIAVSQQSNGQPLRGIWIYQDNASFSMDGGSISVNSTDSPLNNYALSVGVDFLGKSNSQASLGDITITVNELEAQYAADACGIDLGENNNTVSLGNGALNIQASSNGQSTGEVFAAGIFAYGVHTVSADSLAIQAEAKGNDIVGAYGVGLEGGSNNVSIGNGDIMASAVSTGTEHAWSRGIYILGDGSSIVKGHGSITAYSEGEGTVSAYGILINLEDDNSNAKVSVETSDIRTETKGGLGDPDTGSYVESIGILANGGEVELKGGSISASADNADAFIRGVLANKSSKVTLGSEGGSLAVTASDNDDAGGIEVRSDASLSMNGAVSVDAPIALIGEGTVTNAGDFTVVNGTVDSFEGTYTQTSGSTTLAENSGFFGGDVTIAKGSLTVGDVDTSAVSGADSMLALGRSITVSEGQNLLIGTGSGSGVVFGSGSALVVDGNVASTEAMITGEGSLSVDKNSQLYVTNAKAGTSYTITKGLTNSSGEYWTDANLLANRLIKGTVQEADDMVIVATEVEDVASALPGVIPVAGLTTMLAQNLNDTDSGFMGVRFLSRATEPLYMSDDGKAVATINEVSRAAVTAGVQNTSLRLADAASDTVLHHLSLGNFDSGNSIHQNGWDIWATPMYGNTYTHGMSASGASVRGNYGGLAIGADTQVGTLAGGNVRMGAAINGGGGKSETSGTATDTENSYNFGGVNLYAGWNLDSLNIMAALGYSMGSHDVKMKLPASLGMGQAKADVDSHAFTADLRAEYQFKTDWLDILPHAGVRYTALHTDGYDLKVNGSTLNSVDSDTQNIVQFPIGVTVTKNIDVAGWNIKPQADVSVIPAAGDKNASTKVSFSGIDAADSVNTRIMDSTSWAGMLGVQAEKGNLALGLNYGVQASRHETDQRVNVGISWKF